MVCHIWRTKLKTNFKYSIIVQYATDFFRPSTGAVWFLLFFCFWLVWLQKQNILELLERITPFKTFFFFWFPRPPIPDNCWGNFCKEEAVAVELCMQKTILRIETGCSTHAHFLCAHRSHSQQTEPSEGLAGSGSLAQYQIRGVSLNAVDLRVFLEFGTVQTERNDFYKFKGFYHSTYDEQPASTAIQ